MTHGEIERYKFWLNDLHCLAEKYGLNDEQAVRVLENFSDFKKIFEWVEIDKFIHTFLKEVKK